MEAKPLEGKFAAIPYADVAGNSQLTGKDEEGTHRPLSAPLDGSDRYGEAAERSQS